MTENRKLPTFEIAGIPFVVDVDFSLLRHPEKPAITIPFEEMKDGQDHYLLRFNTNTECLANTLERSSYIKEIRVPPMIQLDPKGVADKYSIDISDLPERDSDLSCSPLLLQMRQSGKQPTIDLCGHPFFVNSHFGYLEPQGVLGTELLYFSDMRRDPSNTKYLCLYCPETREMVKLDKPLTGDSKTVVALEIPHGKVLDPYGVARKYGWLGDPGWFNRFPVRYNLKARTRPWEEAIIPSLAQELKRGRPRKIKHRGKRSKL